jgi:hypothetical protein
MIIAVTISVFCIANPQTITGRCLVTINGTYLIVDKNGSPIIMNNQSNKDGLFNRLSSGDKIIIACDMIQTSYPGNTGVTMCMRIAKGSLDDIPEATLSELQKLGWQFAGGS